MLAHLSDVTAQGLPVFMSNYIFLVRMSHYRISPSLWPVTINSSDAAKSMLSGSFELVNC